MRLLLIHSDHIEYEAKKKTKVAEEDAVPKDALDEALAVFCAVESVDGENIEDAVRQAADEIVATARRLGTSNIMIYPYAHLSSDLASPDVAVNVLRGLDEAITGVNEFVVKRAPFGWYKAFSLSCKGHPLSELSRTIVPGEGVVAPKKEVEHEFFVFTPEGERRDVAEYVDDKTPFAALIRKELGYPGPEGVEPAHVALMRAKEIVDYESRSDVGHHRWMPRGKLIRDLLADYVLARVLEYGAMPVETPVMYDLGDRAIAEHAARFGERQYRFKSGNRDMMLRFAACFGMFSIMHDMHISPNTPPMKLYELSTYSFRHEQKGEVIGLKRLRAFTMPDMHTLCRDMDDALASFEEQVAIGWRSGEDLETPLVGVFRCTRDFFEEYESWIKGLVAKSGVPMLIEILSRRTHYWVAKADLAAIDAQGRPIENPTVQIDVESADRFDIKYYTPEGREVHPPILHCSPTGSIERVICALLENAATRDVPTFPTWLAPTQVRVVPVAERHVSFAEETCNRLNAAGIRADVDDRDESVGKKVRAAGMDWVPYVAVIGDREAETDRLTVTIRKLSEKKKVYQETMTEDELIQVVRMETAGKPFRPLYTPRHLSLKPRFV